MKVSRSIPVIGAVVLYALLCSPLAARAQYGATPFHDPATGESYHIEAAATFWNPTPDLKVASTQFGIIGTQISATDDLGITAQHLNELRGRLVCKRRRLVGPHSDSEKEDCR